MEILRDIVRMQQVALGLKRKAKTIGLVPTMGALHEGHLSLIRKARSQNDKVAVSIFVNPIQFGPKEDFKKYPRNFKKDSLLCREQGVDFLFYPEVDSMYPAGYGTYVDMPGLSQVLCGKFRPGHFSAVATVVTKLFNIVQPSCAYFGQKDAQQALVISKMSRDLNIPVEIKILPTLREKDGLAMSSRNRYLKREERLQAVVLSESLRLARDLFDRGSRDPASIIDKMRRLIKNKSNARIQYVCIVDAETLKPVKIIQDKVLVALAAYIGKTRLIDNIVLNAKNA